MKCIVVLLYSLMLLYSPLIIHASPQEEYEEAYKIYIAAGASVAAYNDRIGELATRYLEQDGWRVGYYVQEQGHAGARFLVAQKESAHGEDMYILAIVGTETAEDIKLNLQVDKIYFAGATPEEFAASESKKDVPETEPKVHRGINDYLKAGPAARLRNVTGFSLSLPDLLRSNKSYTLIITGHSLGGAAATLSAARLISMGVKPEQIEVITFGAPAVGNAAFAAKFEPIINLKRVVIAGDPVTGVLQTIVGGYKQFGREITWAIPPTIDDPHKLVGYVDVAIRNYYDKRKQGATTGLESPRPISTDHAKRSQIYIAPFKNNLPSELTDDFWYMREALWDEYNKRFPGCVIATGDEASDWREKAAALDCRWIVLPEVTGLRLKQEKGTYQISIYQTIYEVKSGALVDTAIFSTGTYTVTPLEAFIHALKAIPPIPWQ